ncbi:hypothetical protein ABENE_22460 [Asticcacaulis benevestitus DSM 16100 = ATCC BAA-896]|uniref:HTH LytTR-type domain-containing protein n=2 Tax=Asticcacaulis TaxID=76890 RepID=V4NWF5_9CAUL|nr:hypothetical protein ABENE_22460 [Asticcacaulis benevestitus DSM 16100 = ATCC BAA-896]
MTFRLGRSGVIELVGLVLFGLFLATIAPFGTAAAPGAFRHLYWQLAVIGGGLIAASIEPIFARRFTGNPLLFVLAQLAAMTPAIAVWVSLLPVFIFGEPVSTGRILQLLPDVLSINIAVLVLTWLARKALNPSKALRTAPEVFAPLAIRRKLPPRLARARLIAVEAEDHYLCIRTEAGSALVAMRLGDALDALSPLDGFRTHRSWWVARTAVQAVRWKGGRGTLALSDGSSAPVSRTYAAGLKDTDWAATVAQLDPSVSDHLQ